MYSREGMVSVVFNFAKHAIHFENATKIEKELLGVVVRIENKL